MYLTSHASSLTRRAVGYSYLIRFAEKGRLLAMIAHGSEKASLHSISLLAIQYQ